MGIVSNTFYVDLLQKIGAPPTTNNIDILKKWQNHEGGNATYNPLNTTRTKADSTNYNSVGVKNYGSFDVGTDATAETLLLRYYKPILNAFRDNKPLDFWRNNSDIADSLRTWGTSNFATYLNKPSKPDTTTVVKQDKPPVKDNSKRNRTLFWIGGGVVTFIAGTLVYNHYNKKK